MNVYGKLNSVREMLMVYNNSKSMLVDIKNTYESKFNRIVTIPPHDMLYDYVRVWIHQQVNPKGAIVHTTDFTPTKLPISDKTYSVDIGGHKVKVYIKPTPRNSKISSNIFTEGDDDSSSEIGINFVARTKEAEDAVFDFLQEYLHTIRSEQRPLKKLIPSQYGWESVHLVRREMHTVHLASGVKEDLIEDIKAYESDEERYRDLGIPYHRGFLFYGLPGTGKSSVVRAIASYFDRNLFTLSLSSVKDDDELIDLISSLYKKSILLIEDIDIARDSISREGSEDGVTLSALLNCLDGIHSPDDFIFIATTNDKSVLDPALIRPGRIDKQVYFDYTDQKQFESMFEQFYGFSPDYQIGSEHVASEIVEVFKRNLHDGHAAIEDFKNNERF